MTSADLFVKTLEVCEERGPYRKGLFREPQVFGRGLPVLARLKVEVHDLTFVQAGDACPLKSGNVHEGVFRTIVGLDEAETFNGIEPLYGTLSHEMTFQFNCATGTFR